ncbi:Rieske (2Fe-2S) protein [Streptomyces sp. NPDC056661]|uniref:Rieske (2Fe-2S) protein n=1 Tax=Streptomyces sp. NPDC056661 TaxID=3345898 RepID=UPI0036B80D0C
MSAPRHDIQRSAQDNATDRRHVLAAGGAAAMACLLTACVIQPPEAAQPVPSALQDGGQPTEAQPSGSSLPEAGQEPTSPSGQPLVKLSDLPPGTGTVLKDQKIVVARDSDGATHAFSAVCTHQGCLVASVSGGTINCPCHGSKFDATSGQPVAGPARAPLPPVAIQQRADAVYPA